MAIPDYQSLMLPLLKYVGDGQEHSLRETIDALAERFGLTESERKELLASGQQAIFDNRVGWARTYLKKAGLLVTTRRGYFQVTERGISVLRQNPREITASFLRQFPEFIEFQGVQRDKAGRPTDPPSPEVQTPAEEIESAFQRARQTLAAEIQQALKDCTPAFFEQLVIDLLVKMGYGGTRKDAGQAIGRSGDGGIDGIIKEDRLGLDVIYIQAKRWAETVGRPEIQRFAGALAGQKARKGVFITTADFTQGARDFASFIESKIVLIDGETLARLMIDYNIGVTTVTSYELKRVDSDYFTEE